MADSFKFELVSPESLLISQEVAQVTIPGTEGEMTVMVDHAPVMSTIRPGVVTVTDNDGKVDRYVVFGGFADVLPTGCTLLAESATHMDETNHEEIQKRIQAVRQRITEVQTHEERADLEEYVHQLATLEGTIGEP